MIWLPASLRKMKHSRENFYKLTLKHKLNEPVWIPTYSTFSYLLLSRTTNFSYMLNTILFPLLKEISQAILPSSLLYPSLFLSLWNYSQQPTYIFPHPLIPLPPPANPPLLILLYSKIHKLFSLFSVFQFFSSHSFLSPFQQDFCLYHSTKTVCQGHQWWPHC